MRVLFTATSGRGHFQPMFPLAREQAGVAIAVPRAEVSVERVREALQRVIGDGTFRAAAECAQRDHRDGDARGRRCRARATLRAVT